MNGLKRLAWWLVPLAIACGAETDRGDVNNGGKTHWLMACESDGDCGDGVCAAGSCTVMCEADDVCEALESGAECGPEIPRVTTDAVSCEQASNERTCTLPCEEDSDCERFAGQMLCDDGHCVPRACSDEISCSLVDPAECVASGCDEITGVRFDDSESEVLGCIDKGRGCDDTVTCGRDADGVCWQFGDTCLPVDFEELSSCDECECDGEECPDVPTDPCAGKSCGDPCTLCSPSDDDCEEQLGAQPVCDAEGVCGGPLACEEPAVCADQPKEACGDAGCAEITGSPASLGSFDQEEVLGCMDPDTGCGEAETCAFDGNGTCWRFRSTCLPEGYIEAGSCEECAACEGEECACSERAPSDCAAAGCAEIVGSLIEDGMVPTVREVLGCMDPDTGCGEAETCALDSNGQCWIFPNTCLPESYMQLDCEECLSENSCTSPDDCAQGEFCYKTSCDAPGECRPDEEAGCDGNFLPVCGCDSQTYSNACEASTAGIGVAREGECSGAFLSEALLLLSECSGECRQRIRRDPDTPRLISFEGCESAEVCTRSNVGELTDEGLAAMQSAERALVDVTLEDSYPCTGCDPDGASMFVSLERGGSVSTHQYSSAEAPEVLAPLDAVIVDLMTSASQCMSSPNLQLVDDCTPAPN